MVADEKEYLIGDTDNYNRISKRMHTDPQCKYPLFFIVQHQIKDF